MGFSINSGDSPQNTVHGPNRFSYLQRQSPGTIEPNVSFTRSVQSPSHIYNTSQLPLIQSSALRSTQSESQIESQIESPGDLTNEPQTEEDVKFLRLAQEALVATSVESNLMVDPTIQDLLARLQYVLSPHGNPMKRSESIRLNEKGQLMIQGFYKDFPNLSNNVFSADPDTNPSNKKSEGWNFLLDKPTVSPRSDDVEMDHDTDLGSNSIERMPRKFPCLGCSMLFHRSSDLKRHAKQHLSVPANICPECGKGFARRDALKRHTGTMTCKRNADKRKYYSNLEYLKNR